jgi:hypothetical protein
MKIQPLVLLWINPFLPTKLFDILWIVHSTGKVSNLWSSQCEIKSLFYEWSFLIFIVQLISDIFFVSKSLIVKLSVWKRGASMVQNIRIRLYSVRLEVRLDVRIRITNQHAFFVKKIRLLTIRIFYEKFITLFWVQTKKKKWKATMPVIVVFHFTIKSFVYFNCKLHPAEV